MIERIQEEVLPGAIAAYGLPVEAEQAGFSPMDVGYEVSATLSNVTNIRRIC